MAAKLFPDDISPIVKRERWDRLQELMEEIAQQKNAASVGALQTVLVERVEGGLASGNTHEMKFCRFPSADSSLLGKFVKVSIRSAKAWVLEGVLDDRAVL